jgi:hypothetical protein
MAALRARSRHQARAILRRPRMAAPSARHTPREARLLEQASATTIVERLATSSVPHRP